MNTKVTYKDWYQGRAIHTDAEIFIPVKFKKEIIRFKWDDISDEDVFKIKETQEKIFWEEYNRILKLWKQIFESNLSLYGNKTRYIANELSDIRSILAIDHNLNIIHNELNFLNHKALVFFDESLDHIRRYFQDIILLEKKRDFYFIHSRLSKVSHTEKTPCEIYAQVCWGYYNWLLQISKKIKNDKPLTIEHDEIKVNNYGNSFLSLFHNNQQKVDVVLAALNSLNLTSDSSEREITAFVDAAKRANVLPLATNKKLMEVIFSELKKTIPYNLKSRTDGRDYQLMLKASEKYFCLL